MPDASGRALAIRGAVGSEMKPGSQGFEVQDACLESVRRLAGKHAA